MTACWLLSQRLLCTCLPPFCSCFIPFNNRGNSRWRAFALYITNSQKLFKGDTFPAPSDPYLSSDTSQHRHSIQGTTLSSYIQFSSISCDYFLRQNATLLFPGPLLPCRGNGFARPPKGTEVSCKEREMHTGRQNGNLLLGVMHSSCALITISPLVSQYCSINGSSFAIYRKERRLGLANNSTSLRRQKVAVADATDATSRCYPVPSASLIQPREGSNGKRRT